MTEAQLLLDLAIQQLRISVALLDAMNTAMDDTTFELFEGGEYERIADLNASLTNDLNEIQALADKAKKASKAP